MNIAIIPARGGSKRIKNKNIKKFNKKPIIEYTLKILKKSNIFDLIVLSSDSNKICKLGKKIGFDLVLLRNKNLAKDTTDTKSVIKQVIFDISKNLKIENVCCVYPCNPFLQINDLKDCLKILKKKDNNRSARSNYLICKQVTSQQKECEESARYLILTTARASR